MFKNRKFISILSLCLIIGLLLLAAATAATHSRQNNLLQALTPSPMLWDRKSLLTIRSGWWL